VKTLVLHATHASGRAVRATAELMRLKPPHGAAEPILTSGEIAAARRAAAPCVRLLIERGADQALINILSTPAWSSMATVAATGSSWVGVSVLFQRRRDAKIGSWLCRSVGCWPQASMIMVSLRLDRCANCD
ncbi:MAG: hypothetical protein VXW22_09435, partial [Pseudomonadota bacterium]|nr:hypothetical protein [Pseudomonadota bacterium]